MKLKKLLEGFAWERKPGQPLPTLKDVAKKHQMSEAPIQRSKVDWSTMNLESNIDQKWSTSEIMISDLNQWLNGASSAMGPAAVKKLGRQLKELGMYYMQNAGEESAEDPKQSYRSTNTADRDSKRTSFIDKATGGLYS